MHGAPLFKRSADREELNKTIQQEIGLFDLPRHGPIKGSAELRVPESCPRRFRQVLDGTEAAFRIENDFDDEGLFNQRLSIPPFDGGRGDVNLNIPWDTKGSLWFPASS